MNCKKCGNKMSVYSNYCWKNDVTNYEQYWLKKIENANELDVIMMIDDINENDLTESVRGKIIEKVPSRGRGLANTIHLKAMWIALVSEDIRYFKYRNEPITEDLIFQAVNYIYKMKGKDATKKNRMAWKLKMDMAGFGVKDTKFSVWNYHCTVRIMEELHKAWLEELREKNNKK